MVDDRLAQLTDPGAQIMYSIVGVAPPGLDYPVGVDCWTAAAPSYARPGALGVGPVVVGDTERHDLADEYVRLRGTPFHEDLEGQERVLAA